MKDARWLLACTQERDIRAIDSTLRLAKHCGATIVAVSLCTASQVQTPFEQDAQTRIFLDMVQREAERYQVSVERYQVFTCDVLQSINMLTHELHCTSIVVVISEKQGVLLSTQELRQLLLQEHASSLVLVRLPAYKERAPGSNFVMSFFHWFRKGRKPLVPVAQMHTVPEEAVRTKEERVGKKR